MMYELIAEGPWGWKHSLRLRSTCLQFADFRTYTSVWFFKNISYMKKQSPRKTAPFLSSSLRKKFFGWHISAIWDVLRKHKYRLYLHLIHSTEFVYKGFLLSGNMSLPENFPVMKIHSVNLCKITCKKPKGKKGKCKIIGGNIYHVLLILFRSVQSLLECV